MTAMRNHRTSTTRRRRGLRSAALVAVVALAAAACGGDDDDAEADASGDTEAAAEEESAESAVESAEESAESAVESAEESAESAEESAESAEEADEAEAADSGDPIILGDLAYFTGDFASIGAYLAAQVDFPVTEVINLDPPLGRQIEVIHEDIGTVGEAQAARKLLEQDDADILLSAAHEYFTYRDFILDWQEDNDGPLIPTVHGGVIPKNVGGTGEEPIFRAQGSDEGQGVTNALFAQEIGAESAVIMTTPTAGYQLTADATEKALADLGIEVLVRIDAPGEQASYRTEVQRAVDEDPDVLIVYGQATESAIMVKQAAEAGWTGNILGEPGWVEPEFVETATVEAIASQDLVGYPGFGFQDNEAWAFYQPLWDDNPEYNQHTTADDFYSYTTYDLLVATALAIEAGGSANSSDWAPAMFEVTDAPGTVCYTYQDCLDLLRAGEDIDYDGVTGPATYSEGGINAVIPVMRVFGPDGEIAEEVPIDAEAHLELLAEVASEYEE